MIHQKLKITLLAAVASLGLAASAAAQSMPSTEGSSLSGGLLGQDYVSVGFTYTHFNKGLPKLGHDYSASVNKVLTSWLDIGMSYDCITASTSGTTIKTHKWDLSLVGYLSQSWGKPFVAASGGWSTMRGTNIKFTDEDSHNYAFSTGVEVPVCSSISVTPFVRYSATPDFNQQGLWDYGVVANWRLFKEWSTRVGFTIDEFKNTGYTIGVNYHF